MQALYSSQHYAQQSQQQHYDDDAQSNHSSSSSSSKQSSLQLSPLFSATNPLPAGQLTLDNFLIRKKN